VNETSEAGVTGNVCLWQRSGHFGRALRGLERGGMAEEGLVLGTASGPTRLACSRWLLLACGGARGAGALPAAPAPGRGGARGGLLPMQAPGPTSALGTEGC